MIVVIDWYASVPTIIAPRRTGEASSRSITPRSMSSMNTVPAQELENSAVITTTPGVMNSRYEPDDV